MSLWLVTGPTVEPVDVLDAQVAVSFSGDQVEREGWFQATITAVREWAEGFTGRAFNTQTWDLKLDCGFPCGPIELPKPPVQSVTSITYVDTAGVTQTLSPSLHTSSLPQGPKAMPARVFPAYGQTWPSTRDVPDAVTVRFIAGYGDSPADVPEQIKLAIKLQIGTRLANQEGVVVGTIASVAPQGDEWLLWPFRVDL